MPGLPGADDDGPGAMRISERVLRRVERDYRGRRAEEALYLLDAMNLGGRADEDDSGRERVQVAVLELARGDVGRLLEAAVEAETDWRDILVAAGLEGEDWARRIEELLGDPGASNAPSS